MTRKSKSGEGTANPEVEFNRALELFKGGNHQKAAKVVRALAKKFPNVSEILQLQGLIAVESGKPKDAIKILQKALNVKPDDPKALNNLANAYRGSSQLENARDAYRKSLDIRPAHPETLANLGGVLADLGEFEAAETVLSEAMKLAPDFADVGVNLSFVLIELRKLDQAIDCCLTTLEQHPNQINILNNLGRAYLALGRNDDAEEVIKRALGIDPSHTGALQAMGILHFLHGRWPAAWECYELRWRIQATRYRAFPQPPWAGQPVEGKNLLVWGEQGVGDEILFTSMVPDLVEAGANVILELDPRLVPLYERSFPSITCLPREFPPVKQTLDKGIDYQVAAGSLGRWWRLDEASFPKRSSFLVADPVKTDTLRQRYRDGSESRIIGISWHSANKDIGDEKSMQIMDLAPLARMPGICLVDLQYGDSDMDRAQFEAETGVSVIRDKEIDSLKDLDGFAAQVAAMDLIVSISNTTVHVAGALGVPAWVLLPNAPMWRWMIDRDDTPWYPLVRLFRQNKRGDWPGVMEKVTVALGGSREDFPSRP